MATTGTLTISGSCSGISPSAIVSKSAGSSVTIDESISANQTDLLFAISFDKDRLKMVYLVSTETMTIETNDGTTPGDTITLTADEPLIWWEGAAEYTNPFASADVTAFYLTNTTACTLSGFILHDPTA